MAHLKSRLLHRCHKTGLKSDWAFVQCGFGFFFFPTPKLFSITENVMSFSMGFVSVICGKSYGGLSLR